MLKVKVINRIDFPEIALQEHLEHIAQNIIIPDILMRIDNGAAITGGMLPSNEAETIKRKGHDRQLIETGTLRSSLYHKSISKSKVLVTVESIRKKIGEYLQEGIMAKGKLKQYLFFGISKAASDGAFKYMDNKLKELTSGGKRSG